MGMVELIGFLQPEAFQNLKTLLTNTRFAITAGSQWTHFRSLLSLVLSLHKSCRGWIRCLITSTFQSIIFSCIWRKKNSLLAFVPTSRPPCPLWLPRAQMWKVLLTPVGNVYASDMVLSKLLTSWLTILSRDSLVHGFSTVSCLKATECVREDGRKTGIAMFSQHLLGWHPVVVSILLWSPSFSEIAKCLLHYLQIILGRCFQMWYWQLHESVYIC